jgi:transglutaminase-like putative cysteine protease
MASFIRRAAAWSSLALLAGMAHAASNPTLPDWVMQAAESQGEWGSARAVYLLEDTLLTIQPDGRPVERYRAVVKILRPQGREYARPAAWFSRDAKLESFHVWSIGPDGHRYAMKDSEYVEEGDPAYGMLYVDLRRKTATAPGTDPGGIVAWEVTEQLPSYLSEDTWGFQNSVPTARSIYEIDLPAGWHQEAVWSRHPALQPTEVAPNHFRWEQTNVDGIDLSDVPLAPAWASLAGRMTVHFSADPLPQGDALWARIGGWYTNLAAPRSEGGADISAMAKSLAGNGDFMARLERIADFMQQQIRYVGIEIGIGGLQPHAAEDIFHSRYGDCKDKATLMITMLDAVGIRATWMPVDDRRGVVDPQAPSMAGDHMIMAIEIPQGLNNPRLQAVVTARNGKRYLIFDPTNEYVPIGQLPEYEQGSWALLAAGADSQVIQLPVLKPENDTTERTAKFELAADGTLKGTVKVTHAGASAWGMRDRLALDSDKQRRELLERLVRQDFPTFTLGEEKAEHVRELDQPLELDYSLTAPSYAKAAGDLLLVRPRVVGSVADGLDDKPRRVPVSFDGVRTWRDDFDVKIPAGYKVDDVPDPVNVDVGFATYRSQVKADGGVLHYQREYVLKKLELPPDQYPALRKLEGEITSDENGSAVLKKE